MTRAHLAPRKVRVHWMLLKAVGLLLLAATNVAAQELTSVRVSRSEVGIGEAFELQLQLKKIENSAQTICNLLVDFGDGRTEQVRITGPNYSVTLSYAYKRAGVSVIQVGGKTHFQGLNSAVGCFGDNKTVAVNVLPENFAVRRAAALAEKEAALQRAEAENAAAAAAAADARRQRSAAQNAASQARVERAAAERLARDAALRRAAAQRDANSQRVVPPRPGPPAMPAPASKAPAPSSAAAASEKTKPAAPKPKSSLDL